MEIKLHRDVRLNVSILKNPKVHSTIAPTTAEGCISIANNLTDNRYQQLTSHFQACYETVKNSQHNQRPL